MKKTISILLIVAMMLAATLAIIPVSAASGDKITSAADFAAMKADGKYYLANDITVSASYAETFKGTLDGDGNTVTVIGATPLFKKIEGGTVSNLNIVANFEAEKPNGNYGALAGTASGTFESINVEVNALFTGGATADQIGGVIGAINGATDLFAVTAKGSLKQETAAEMDNSQNGFGGIIGSVNVDGKVNIQVCENRVDVYCNLTRAGTAGIVGASNGSTQLVIEYSQNYGTVDSNGKAPGGSHQGTAGFVGIMNSNGNKKASLEIYNSRNYGDVKSTHGGDDMNNMKGGFLGRGYGPTKVVIEGCVNTGDISGKATGWTSSGGIIGSIETYNYHWSNNNEATIKVTNCANIGTIVNAAYSGGIFGSMLQGNSPNVKLTIENCANYGDVTGSASGGMLGKQGDGGANALEIIGCYNAGKANSAMVQIVALDWCKCCDSCAVNYDVLGKQVENDTWSFTAPYPVPVIENCYNEGQATNLVGSFSTSTNNGETAGKMTIKNSYNDNGAVAPGGDSYEVTPTEDEYDLYDQVIAAVPGNPAELDVILADYAGLVAEDYESGWEAFAEVYIPAVEAVNQATTQAELDAFKAPLEEKSADLVLKAVDTAPLIAAIEAADEETDNEALYTPLTWAAFTAALANAEDVLAAASTAKPSTVINATAKLVTAQEGLELIPDKAPLTAAIAKYEAYNEADYVSTAWAGFVAVIDAAKALVDDVNATQDGVDGAIEAMDAAAKALPTKVDPKALKAKTDELVATYKAEDYTARTHNELNNVIRKANDAISANDMSQADVDAFMKQLDDAVNALVKKGNFDAVDALLEPFGDVTDEDNLEALGDLYTRDSLKAFKEALEAVANAKKEDKKPNFSEKDAEKLLATVKSAVDGLVAFANYGDIDAKIAEVNALDKTKYTEESWKALQDAITAANALKSNRGATQPEADDALAKINAAVEALAEVSADAGDNGGEDKKGCGSAIGATVVVMTATLALGATVVLKKKD